MSQMSYRIVDLATGAHFTYMFPHLPHVGDKISLNDIITITIVEFNLPNSLVVESNSTYDELVGFLNG